MKHSNLIGNEQTLMVPVNIATPQSNFNVQTVSSFVANIPFTAASNYIVSL